MLLRRASRASALTLSLIFASLLALEALMVNSYLLRDSGEQGALSGYQTMNRRASELVTEAFKKTLYSEHASQGSEVPDLWAKYKLGGTDTTYANLLANRHNLVNPETGATEAFNVETSAWIQEVRGSYVHLVGRAKSERSDYLTHRWIMMDSCNGSRGAVLTTILSNASYPGYNSTAVDPNTGRVFFGTANNTSNTGSNLYTWHISTGLSTIVSNQSGVGNRSLKVAPDGRAFFGEGPTGNDSFWTWKDGVLSTLIDGLNGAGRGCSTCGQDNGDRGSYLTFMDDRTGRVYFAAQSGGALYTWKNGTLETVYSDGSVAAKLAIAGPNQIYWTDKILVINQIFRWTEGVGTENPGNLLGVNLLGTDPISATNDGRIFYNSVSVANISIALGSWKQGGPNSLVLGVFQKPAGPKQFREFATGEVFIGANDFAGIWNPASPAAVTTLSTSRPGGMAYNSSMVAAGDSSANGSIYAWSSAKGLSVILSNDSYLGENDGLTWRNNRLYFGQRKNSGNVYVWDSTTRALTTIALAGVDNPGVKGSIAADNDNRMYFGSNSASGGVWTYKEGMGLLTILTNRPYPGEYSMTAHPTDGVYFGENSNNGNFYYYSVPKACDVRAY